ncbi:MAG: cysteine desulfurase [Cyclobacteriaceae bacterium]
MKVYLDNAATTPMDPQVWEAMLPMMQNHFGNPSSIHSHGREVRSQIEKARKKVAELLNTSPAEIFFTSGGTEADNTILTRCIIDLGVKRIITSKIEHHAVLHTAELLSGTKGVELSFVQLDKDGTVDLNHLKSLLQSSDQKTLVSLMHGNNEIGNLIDLHEVGTICKEHSALFHSDTVQTMAHLPIDLENTPIDFIVGAAHKFNGPKGVGFMYINHNVKISPFIHGGAQERNMRAGTENVYGIIGLAKALEIAHEEMTSQKTHIEGLKKQMIEQLKANIPDVLFNGKSDSLDESLYTVLSVSLPPSHMKDMLLFSLDIAGVSASGGSACSSGSNIGSHVLAELDRDQERGAIRFSFSKFNTPEEINYAVEKLSVILAVPA